MKIINFVFVVAIVGMNMFVSVVSAEDNVKNKSTIIVPLYFH